MVTTSTEPGASCSPLFDALLDREDAVKLATALRVLADPARLRILSLIAANPEGAICQARFTGPLELAQSTVSHHLKVLHDAGLVHREQRGSWAYYSLAPQRLKTLLRSLWPEQELELSTSDTAGTTPALTSLHRANSQLADHPAPALPRAPTPRI